MPPQYLKTKNAIGKAAIIAPPPITAVPATINTPINSPTIIFIVLRTPIVIPIVNASVMHKPGVMEITKNTGIKK